MWAGQDFKDYTFTVNCDAAPAGYTRTVLSPAVIRTVDTELKVKFFTQADGKGDVVGIAGAIDCGETHNDNNHSAAKP